MICSVLLLVSCGAGSVLKYFDSDVEDEGSFSDAQELENIGRYYGDGEGNLALFVGYSGNKTTYNVYNVDIGNVVYSGDGYNGTSDSTDLYFDFGELDNGVSYYVVTAYSNGEIKYAELYNGKSENNLVARSTVEPRYAEHYDEIVVFDNVAYVANDDGDLIKSFDVDEFANFVDASFVGNDYVYSLTSDALVAYDKKGSFVSGYTFSSTASSHESYVLADGNVMIQYYVELPDDASSYDVYMDDSKYDIVTEIFNVKKGSSKKVKVDYIVEYIVNSIEVSSYDELYGLVEDFDLNIARIVYFKDGYVDENNADTVILNNNLKVKASFNDVVSGAERIVAFWDGVFAVIDKYENVHIVDERGKELKTLNYYSISGKINNYFATEKCIYDNSFRKVYDLVENGYEIETIGKDYFILSKDTNDGTEYAKFYNGNVSVIVAADGDDYFYTYNNLLDLYCIREESGKYAYYNGNGTLVGEFNSGLDLVIECEDAAVVSTGAGYYRLTKK